MNDYAAVIAALRTSSNPVVRLKIQRDVLGEIHWVLVMLAELQYPAGDAALAPLREQVHARAWPVASYVDEVAARLLRYQWPDGGWNCDRDPNLAATRRDPRRPPFATRWPARPRCC